MAARTLPHASTFSQISAKAPRPKTVKRAPVPIGQIELRALILSIVDIDRRETQLKRFEAGLAKRLRAGASILPGKFTARLLRRRGRIFVEVL